MGTPDILKKIVLARAKRLREEMAERSLVSIKETITGLPTPPSFYQAIAKKGLTIIGEIKQASPSKGIIREAFDPVTLALQYDTCVDVISVLTEQDYFKGHAKYLSAISERSVLPLLRKDFILDPYQIYEARALGASSVLLITAILTDDSLKGFLALTQQLAMDALVEVHDEEELKMALGCGASIIGINNRDLHTFEVDLLTTKRLADQIPNGILIVSESGIHSGADVKLLGKRVNGILVGESFMVANVIAEKAKELKEAYDS